ncbi:uncharacterized protein LOC124343768 isoform X1 [Daphnia pulicaria]|uniref:uncharacterized protein LOC124343768 isoform X1 n=1 Tax=Daphnia pulicaria TaxID=35523 RepID=UPI001EEC87E0|nr:uncharacterized protein LOC124343768 isoform X1 [Daphnia pulicaria]XP_046653201.1 uncharacterized protein LOC124343768 isoform X1 [Daphnia pulicaria]
MTFVNVNIVGQSTFLLRLTWTENNGEISLFDYGKCKTWKGQIGEEKSKKIASLLKLNMTDYKSQLEQAVKSSSTTHSITLIDNNLAIKKQTSSGVLFNIAVIPLQELEFTTTLPEFMAEIDKSMTQMSDELVAKDNLIDKLNKEIEKLMTKYQERVKDVEELTPRLYAQFSIAFNHLKERLSAENPGKTEESLPIDHRMHAPEINEKSSRPSTSRIDSDYDADTDVDTDSE